MLLSFVSCSTVRNGRFVYLVRREVTRDTVEKIQGNRVSMYRVSIDIQ
jgi:hypothetical protein